MKTYSKTYARLPVDDNGYVVGVRCHYEHSGNRRFVQEGYWCQCQGCGHIRYTADLWEQIESKAK